MPRSRPWQSQSMAGCCDLHFLGILRFSSQAFLGLWGSSWVFFFFWGILCSSFGAFFVLVLLLGHSWVFLVIHGSSWEVLGLLLGQSWVIFWGILGSFSSQAFLGLLQSSSSWAFWGLLFLRHSQSSSVFFGILGSSLAFLDLLLWHSWVFLEIFGSTFRAFLGLLQSSSSCIFLGLLLIVFQLACQQN